ncbi:unnamed protein product [Brassica oleracea]
MRKCNLWLVAFHRDQPHIARPSSVSHRRSTSPPSKLYQATEDHRHITGGVVMPLEVIVVICLRYVMETRGVDVEKRWSHRVIIFPLPFFTIINGEPLDMHFIATSV